MPGHEVITRVLGHPLGGKRESLDPLMNAFSIRGIVVHRETISSLRRQGSAVSGERVAFRVLCSEVLARGSSIGKDSLYLDMALKAQQQRRRQSGRNPHRYLSTGFTEAVAEQTSINAQDVRKYFRAMRADLAYAEYEGLDRDTKKAFREAGISFIDSYTPSIKKDSSPGVDTIENEWDRQSIKEFYELLYQGGPRLISIWLPYEIEALSAFYQARLFLVPPSPLTLFDRIVLKSYMTNIHDDKVAEKVRKDTGIEIGRDVLYNHRGALVAGKLRKTIPETK